ncbi:MAG: anti-virulence regulator CigR family protein [Gammaproteobacteria bacterium]
MAFTTRNLNRIGALCALTLMFASTAVLAGNPHSERGIERGGPGKGQGDMQRGAPGHSGDPGRADRHRPEQAHGGQQAHQSGRGSDAGPGGREHWQREWEADEFLAAGFTAAAAAALLGDDVALLHAGARPLPPGIAKNLARGKPLPPGIARQQPGGQVLTRLPRVRGHEWYGVGRDLVLVEAGTLIVVEILRELGY